MNMKFIRKLPVPKELKEECTTRRIPGKTPSRVKASSNIFPEVEMGFARFRTLVSFCSISTHCIDISASGTVGLNRITPSFSRNCTISLKRSSNTGKPVRCSSVYSSPNVYFPFTK